MAAAARNPGSGKKSPLFGAAVVKAVLRKRTGDTRATSSLYEGILRDLGVTDADNPGGAITSLVAKKKYWMPAAERSSGM